MHLEGSVDRQTHCLHVANSDIGITGRSNGCETLYSVTAP